MAAGIEDDRWAWLSRVPPVALALVAALAGVALAAALAPDLAGGYLLFPLASTAAVSLGLGARAGAVTAVAAIALLAWAFRSVPALALPKAMPDLRLLFFLGASIPVVVVSDAFRNAYRRAEARRAAASAREREWAAIAAFGRRALGGRELAPLVEDAVATVAQALRADGARFVPASPGCELVEASWGTCQRAHRRARANVRLRSDRAPCGTLEVYARSRLRLRVEEVRFVQTFAAVLATAIQHVQAEAHVTSQLEFSRAVTANLAEGVCVLDEESRTAFLNPAGESMLGWRESELLGQSFHDLVHRPGDLSDRRCAILEVFATGSPVENEEDTFVHRDGTRVPVAWRAAPLVTAGRVAGLVLSFRDMTGTHRARQAERLLAEAGRVLAESLDEDTTLVRVARLAVPDLADWCMVVLVDDGAPRRVAVEAAPPVSPEAARDLLATYPIDFEAKHGVGRVLRTREPELLPDARAFVEESGADADLRSALLDRIGLFSFMAVPLVARGRLLGVLDFAVARPPRRYGQDDLVLALALAERCALAIDNARLYREARDATSARDDVLSIVSHDLKNPLAAIKAGAGALARTAEPGSVAARVGPTLIRAADRMNRLVSDLVDLASLDAGRLSMHRRPVDTAEIASEVVQALAPVAADEGVALRLDAPASAPASADRERIAQALGNLVVNAIKATEPGGEIRVRVERRDGTATLHVTDTGHGIAAEDLPHVFDRYWRSASVRYAGQGLGLAIVKRIVDAHGGRIRVESLVGQGTTFSVDLPAA